MTVQPALTNGAMREFVFPVAATNGMMISGQMSVCHTHTPAVIRLTHSKPNSKPCSAYSRISNNYIVNENDNLLAHTSLYKELELAKENVFHNDKNGIAGSKIHNVLKSNFVDDCQISLSGTACDQDAVNVLNHDTLIDALLKSNSNIRPASRQSTCASSTKSHPRPHSDVNHCEHLHNSKPCSRPQSSVNHHVYQYSKPHTRPQSGEDFGEFYHSKPHTGETSIASDEENAPEGSVTGSTTLAVDVNEERTSERKEQNDNNILTDTNNVNINSHRTPNKKGKRNKKRSKSQGSFNLTKPYIVANSTKIIKISKMKIPSATKTTKQNNNESKKETKIIIENNLLQVQAQGKPLLVCKQARLTSQESNIEDRSNTARSSKSENGPSTEKHKSTGVSLPQVAKEFMVNSGIDSTTSTTSSIHHSNNGSSTNRSFIFPNNKLSLHQAHEIARLTKIYLSEKHSGSLKDCGMEFPCAPPATPTPEKEAQKRSAKQKEDKAKIDKQMMKDKEKDQKLRQRREIYALNAIMTELEHKRFMEFCNETGDPQFFHAISLFCMELMLVTTYLYNNQ
ncbi:hypothetical protein KUTeg_001702, partial [Tegillarca granosa]